MFLPLMTRPSRRILSMSNARKLFNFNEGGPGGLANWHDELHASNALPEAVIAALDD